MLCTKRMLTDVRMEPLLKASSPRKATILSGQFLEESESDFLLVSFLAKIFNWYNILANVACVWPIFPTGMTFCSRFPDGHIS